MVVAVAAAVKVCVAPETPEPPEAVVVMVWLAKPLLDPALLNVNAPNPPLLILVTATVGSLVFVNVQAMLAPSAVAAAFNTKAPVAKLGVAVPPVPMPLQAADAKA